MISGGEKINVQQLIRFATAHPESIVARKAVDEALSQGQSSFQNKDDYQQLVRTQLELISANTPFNNMFGAAAFKYNVVQGGHWGEAMPEESSLGNGWLGVALFGAGLGIALLRRWENSIQPNPLADPRPSLLPQTGVVIPTRADPINPYPHLEVRNMADHNNSSGSTPPDSDAAEDAYHREQIRKREECALHESRLERAGEHAATDTLDQAKLWLGTAARFLQLVDENYGAGTWESQSWHTRINSLIRTYRDHHPQGNTADLANVPPLPEMPRSTPDQMVSEMNDAIAAEDLNVIRGLWTVVTHLEDEERRIVFAKLLKQPAAQIRYYALYYYLETLDAAEAATEAKRLWEEMQPQVDECLNSTEGVDSLFGIFFLETFTIHGVPNLIPKLKWIASNDRNRDDRAAAKRSLEKLSSLGH